MATEHPPLFILGAPRSGTTFIASLLKPTIYGEPFETHFITKYFKRLRAHGVEPSREQVRAAIRGIFAERPVLQMKPRLSASDAEDLAYSDGQFSFAALADCICRSASYNPADLPSWGDKTPNYIGDLPIILELFPDSQFVFIVRDGRDVTLSLLHREWGPNNVYSAASYWRHLHRHIHLLEDARRAGRAHFVKYEDLIENPEVELPKVYEFLGESIDESEYSELVATTKKGNSFKWKSKMNDRQKAVFEDAAGDTLDYFGYERVARKSAASVGSLTKAAYTLHDQAMRAKQLFKENVIDTFKIKFLGKEPFAD